MAEKLYETMFLVDAGIGDDGLPDLIRYIAEQIGRFDAELERIEKWDERDLAYPIGDAKRGIYLLVYFRVDTERLPEIQRVLNISERIVRFILLKAERLPPASGIVYDEEGNMVESADDGQEQNAEGEESPEEEETAAAVEDEN